jgi:hypothetical protein
MTAYPYRHDLGAQRGAEGGALARLYIERNPEVTDDLYCQVVGAMADLLTWAAAQMVEQGMADTEEDVVDLIDYWVEQAGGHFHDERDPI